MVFPVLCVARSKFAFRLLNGFHGALLYLSVQAWINSIHTMFSDCGGGQEEWPCGKPCPRSCSDLHGDAECLDSPECNATCGCPGDTVLQDGACVARQECRCKYHDSSANGSILILLTCKHQRVRL